MDLMISPSKARAQFSDSLDKRGDRLSSLVSQQGNKVSYEEVNDLPNFLNAEFDLRSIESKKMDLSKWILREDFRAQQIREIHTIFWRQGSSS